MSNFDTVVLDGEMGLFTTIREGDLPYYTAATEVTPSDQTQTLPTADTIVTSNITINPIPDIDLEEVQVTYTPDEEGQTDTITPSTGYAGISEVEVTIEPIDSEYVGSDIPRNDSDDLTASGATITAPAGYYENDATKTIASGTAGTPTATKGTVSNHSVSVTPSVTNTTGYITGGTKTGTAVTVSASELVSGSQNITSNDTYDVTNLASVTVAVPGDTPTLQTKSVSYTPTESAQSATVTADQGYDGLDEVNVSVGAISSSYVGSAIDRRDSTDLSASGATVTAPAGFYESDATKTLDEQAAQTIHPSTSDQTIASGKYLAGDQTIKAVTTTNLTAANIVSGVTVEIGDADDSDCVASVTGTASGGGLEEKAVNFYDYDGELLYSYTAQEFLALNAFPANPTHTGLTAQGWNWSLADAKAYLTSYPNADMNIGQMYRTTSGATEIDITLGSDFLKPYLVIAVNGTVDVDWGDNSAHSTLTGTSLTAMKNVLHEYASSGNYTISLSVTSGTFTLNNGSGNAALLSYTTSLSSNRTYSGAIKAIRFGQGIQTIGGAKCLQSVEYITIPNTVTDVGIFDNDWSLKHITIPSGVTTLATSAFNENWKLKSISIPNSVTTINGSSFNGCVELQSVTLPSAVTVSGGSIFAYCHSLRNVVLPNSITTIQSTMFRENYEIEEYTVPSFITGLNQGCFRADRNMKSVTLPEGLTTIAQEVFFDCKNLRSITIPSTVTSIGSSAFQNCLACNEYHFKSTTPPELSASNVFNGGSLGTTIYVPVGCLTDYQTATNYPTSSGTIYVEE